VGNEININKSQNTTLIELKYIELSNMEKFDVDRKKSEAKDEEYALYFSGHQQ